MTPINRDKLTNLMHTHESSSDVKVCEIEYEVSLDEHAIRTPPPRERELVFEQRSQR